MDSLSLFTEKSFTWRGIQGIIPHSLHLLWGQLIHWPIRFVGLAWQINISVRNTVVQFTPFSQQSFHYVCSYLDPVCYTASLANMIAHCTEQTTLSRAPRRIFPWLCYKAGCQAPVFKYFREYFGLKEE